MPDDPERKICDQPISVRIIAVGVKRRSRSTETEALRLKSQRSMPRESTKDDKSAKCLVMRMQKVCSVANAINNESSGSIVERHLLLLELRNLSASAEVEKESTSGEIRVYLSYERFQLQVEPTTHVKLSLELIYGNEVWNFLCGSKSIVAPVNVEFVNMRK